ncbi:Chaperone protein DnaK OS=Streptomyces fumanus OX=67302 GN=dnaK PE=2 SV=1 [Streptomyces fumanus]
MGQALYAQAEQPPTGGTPPRDAQDDDAVVDAEIVDDDKDTGRDDRP